MAMVCSPQKDDAVIAVEKITFQSLWNVKIKSAHALQARIPKSFTGTDAFSNQPLTLDPGNNVQNAVSFKLDPKFQGSNLAAVCVTVNLQLTLIVFS